jgi:hypothetical protein
MGRHDLGAVVQHLLAVIGGHRDLGVAGVDEDQGQGGGEEEAGDHAVILTGRRATRQG